MRFLAVSLLILGISTLAADASGDSTCETCHRALDRRNSESVELWKGDLHREVGMGCHSCHGGDPGTVAGSMSPSAGFKGAIKGPEAVRLCGDCHSGTGTIEDPTGSADQKSRYLSGSHGRVSGGGRPTCVNCHGSHGIKPVTNPDSPVFATKIVDLCLDCHGGEEGAGRSTAGRYLEGVHGRAMIHATNRSAPGCPDCHGAHSAAVPGVTGILLICGNCHTREYEYYQAGPHGEALRQTGVPSCTRCHGYHGIRSTGIEEIIGHVTDNCTECHEIGGRAFRVGARIDESLGVAMSLLGSMEDFSEEFRLSGIDTSDMERLNREAYGWLLQVESAIHSVESDWEELTGMAKVKMMASWDLARDYKLEKGIRTMVLLLVALISILIFSLLAYKLHLVEKEQERKRALGGLEEGGKEHDRT